jgi:hypothetical protein
VFVSPTVVEELKRIIKESEITKWVWDICRGLKLNIVTLGKTMYRGRRRTL